MARKVADPGREPSTQVASRTATRRGRAGRRRGRGAADSGGDVASGAARATADAGRDAPTLLIDLAPDLAGGFLSGDFDVQIRGRAAASQPIESIELITDGEMVGRTEYGGLPEAEAVTLPNGVTGQQRAFQFNLRRSKDKAEGPCRLTIRAATRTGFVREEPFELMLDPTALQPVKLVSGPTQPTQNFARMLPPILLCAEYAQIDANGVLSLQGWSVTMNPLVAVQVHLGDGRRLAARLGYPRDDVATYYGAYPNARDAGFALTAQVTDAEVDATTTLRVQAFSLNGFLQEMVLPVQRASGHSELRPEALDQQRRIYHIWDEARFDALGELRVVGWAVCAKGIAEVAVEVDGRRVGEAELGLPRPDIGEQFAANPMAGSAGFRFQQVIPGLAAGEHEVRLVVRNVQGDRHSRSRRLRSAGPPPPTVADLRPTSTALPEFRFELDSPRVVDGAAVEPVTKRLTIEGWVLAHSGVAGIDLRLDDVRLGEAYYGLARQDVGAAYPEWNNALRSGYAFQCASRSLREGEHLVTLTVRARNGQELVHRFRISVRKSADADELTGIRLRMYEVEAALLAATLDTLGHRPKFHLLLLCQGASIAPDRLGATLESLRNQVYDAWRLTVLVDRRGAAAAVRQRLLSHAGGFGRRVAVLAPADPKFKAVLGAADGSGTLYGVLRAGDVLGCDALAEIAVAAGLCRGAAFFYADEVRLNPASQQREAFFKPDLSPDLLLSTNYIGRPWFATTALLRRCGVTARELLKSGEHDLVLRCTELAGSIRHVPRLLAQRGPETPDHEAQSRAALARAAKRRGIAAEVLPGCLPGTFRLKRTRRASGKVSIIIPTCGTGGFIKTCIRTLRETTAYGNYEIVCVDDIGQRPAAWRIWLQQNADRIVDVPEAFNWSRFNNLAADACDSEYLLFLNDDIEFERKDWLDALLEHAQRPEVGAVGPQLLYPDRKVQHAGMFLGASVGRHAFRFARVDEPGYFGLALTQRNVIAVTGACMLMRRSAFDDIGRFEETYSVVNSDVDFCLRAHRAGKLIVFTPHATLIHHEHADLLRHERPHDERTQAAFQTRHFEARWRTLFAAGDPYFSPRLLRHSDDYGPDDEPTQRVFAGHPMLRREDVHRILAVKLDHIGDFVTALPAIRRLKALFPKARIAVLASRAARAFASLEPAIDKFIDFEFFHARSQLGEKDLTGADFDALRARLRAYRFDLAIDLRQQQATREVLRCTCARFLAGYDVLGRFPFLDIALEWDGDKSLHRKRSHVVDDLLALVEAVNIACTTNRDMFAIAPKPIALKALPESVRALFALPVVAIHPNVGNSMRQWPEEHFAALIDLIVERNGVNVLLVGGPDDCAVAESLLRRALLPERVASVAGRLPLADLPGVLRRCALFVGNNSGPQHIAAALGMPTIGLHSGVTDATAWGPIGPRAMALQRNMSCSPCYLSREEDCPRNLACLRLLEPSVVYEAVEVLLARPIAVLPLGMGGTMQAHSAPGGMKPPDRRQAVATSSAQGSRAGSWRRRRVPA